MYDALRPYNMGEDAWNTLVEAWENGLSDKEASLLIMRNCKIYITAKAIETMCAENTEIAMLRASLLDGLIAKAKMNVAQKLNEGDIVTSKWYLEKKKASEFSSKGAQAFEKGVDDLSLEEKQRQLAKEMMRYES